MIVLPAAIQQFQVPLIVLNNILALGLKPGITRIVLTLPTLVILVLQSYYKREPGYFNDEYPTNCMIMALAFMYVNWILLATPDRKRWHKIRYGKDGKQDGSISDRSNDSKVQYDDVPQSFWERVWWGARLATSNRYVGWSQQAKNVRMEVSSDYPRWLFLVRKSLRAALFYLLKDAIYAYSASLPYGNWRGANNGKILSSTEGIPWNHRFVISWVYIVLTYVVLELYNLFYGIAAVATGLSNPRDCPSMFGDLAEMVTIRKCWSVVWHQQLRRICSDPAIWLARDILHLRKGSFASKYLQLYLGFFISALIHAVPTAMILHSWKDANTLPVFMAQALMIMVEDHVIDLGKSAGLRESVFWRIVGHAWTITWFGLSTAPYAAKVVGYGQFVHEKTPDFFGIGPSFQG
ncbi:membrane bound O-acyl transferase family-domain-containing protein [Massariosphaeria phaeospora]|uniref:Membrane bound O-acyl transferase family-domain-containing protein n=1 Tax=Massariosphaeria phaeospora TaxID=100035 RepID=A0A7C8I802_9PLEO|nr:membrane bound O-acyl transferase family-domain-containing protein [Massariosphaeria phaeospora]